jgi:hypothetical protein
VHLLNGSGVSCEGPMGEFRRSTHHETFNTLKNQGYNFEHNYGHGYQYLSTNFSNLMLLAFFIDQIQQRCCYDFKLALQQAKDKKRFWRNLRTFTINFMASSWEDVYKLIAKRIKYHLVVDSS